MLETPGTGISVNDFMAGTFQTADDNVVQMKEAFSPDCLGNDALGPHLLFCAPRDLGGYIHQHRDRLGGVFQALAAPRIWQSAVVRGLHRVH